MTNDTLSSGEVTTLYNEGKGIAYSAVAVNNIQVYLEMDEAGLGHSAFDSENSNDGAETGTTIDGNRRPASGHYATFDNDSDQFISVGSDSSIDEIWDGAGSVSVWVRPHDIDSGAKQFLSKIDADEGWALYHNAAVVHFWQYRATNTGHWFETTCTIVANEWAHIVWTYDDDSVSNNPIIYVNGGAKMSHPTGRPAPVQAPDSPAGRERPQRHLRHLVRSRAWPCGGHG